MFTNLRKYLDSAKILYISFFVILLVVLFSKNIHFEPIEAGAIRQILNPQLAKGPLSYGPQHHYGYIVASLAKWFGYKDNFTELAWVFFLFEMALAILILIKLCNFLFKNDKLILTLVVMMFILSQSGQIDQKTMAIPLYLLAIYFFLREKWLISAVFGASIFYLHVGLAVWWFLPSCFALASIWLLQRRISLRQMVNYSLAIAVLASPIIYFYLSRIRSSGLDTFSTSYFNHLVWGSSSILLTLRNDPMRLVNILPMLAVFLVGYNKARKAGYKNDNIMPIAIGVLILYIANFIFADMWHNSTAITLQLLRSVMYVEFFASLFLAFLLAKQLRSNNYIFFFIFVIVSFNYPLLRKFLGVGNQLIALNAFYLILLVYEIFESFYLKEVTSRANRLLQRPIIISVFLIFVSVPQLQVLKPYMRSILNIPQHANVTTRESLLGDIANFTNEKIADKNAILVVPFLENDFEYYTNHKTFITFFTPIVDIQKKNKASDFKYILENDLNYSFEKLFENYSNENFHKKWVKIWEGLDEDTIRRWKERYGVTHVIREKELPLDFPKLYQNQFYVIYEI